ncbi:hypothetical protein CWI39_0278p0010 [Hamiltosporidium magnivora]|uniref:Uncharacterized protein n=1 Tax=Hamiltosporidium magnivora TaxID=148818 RepID=A0A4Q9LKU7_9MICR|nr:hypothetical protein CWI39_0278p0010 [Hamiltosporidium magnivora]
MYFRIRESWKNFRNFKFYSYINEPTDQILRSNNHQYVMKQMVKIYFASVGGAGAAEPPAAIAGSASAVAAPAGAALASGDAPEAGGAGELGLDPLDLLFFFEHMAKINK